MRHPVIISDYNDMPIAAGTAVRAAFDNKGVWLMTDFLRQDHTYRPGKEPTCLWHRDQLAIVIDIAFDAHESPWIKVVVPAAGGAGWIGAWNVVPI